MIIKELSCDCFAGVRDVSVRFKDGMNILLGDNESGKSTLADLLYHLFFQEAKLDGRKDKAFLESCFPKTTDGDGDTIDGAVKFETENGTYKLRKEWSAAGTTRLTRPSGTPISDAKKIRAILDQELKYRRGIFDEVIFASQKRQPNLLEDLLEQRKAKKNDESAMDALAGTISKAVLETGGVAMDRLEKRLTEELAQRAGHWDFTAQMPEGGKARSIRNPWKRDCGSILSAYYAMETVAQKQQNAEDAEKEIERINDQIRAARQQKQTAAAQRERFAACQTIISNRANLNALLKNEQARMQDLQNAAHRWPQLEANAILARQLGEELNKAVLYQVYTEVSAQKQKHQAQSDRLAQLGTIDAADIRTAETCQRSVQTLEAKIQGLNLAANLRLLGDTPVSVVSAATGEELDIGSGAFSITEAVEIRVPDVMELQLMPRGVDLDQVRSDLAQARNRLAAIFEAYGVDSVAALRDNFEEARSLRSNIANLESQMDLKLNGLDWEAVEAAADPTADSVTNVQMKIRKLCGIQSIEKFLGTLNGQIQSYRDQYTSQEALAATLAEAESRAETYRRKLSEIHEIPAEYQAVTDADAYAAQLKAAEARWDEKLEALTSDLLDAQTRLDEKSAEEYAEEYRTLREKFQEEQARYYHWKHIYDVFMDLKSREMGDPTQDIQKHLREYLTALTDGNLRLEEMDEKLHAAMVSGDSRLTCATLSEGTKDTISLAFRLAMLEHLYPEGGAVAVFDDPFTDMDPRRTAQACRLLQRFAQRNQVLFITCDDKYTGLLEGNVISMED